MLISILSLASMVVGASLPPMGISLLAHECKLMTGQIDWLATVLVQESVCTYRAMPSHWPGEDSAQPLSLPRSFSSHSFPPESWMCQQY